MRYSLSKSSGQSRAWCSAICSTCFCCPSSATRTTAKQLRSLVPVLRFNLMSSCNYTNRGLATTRLGSGNRTCHLSVSLSQEIPLLLGLGSSLPLHFGVSHIQVIHGPALPAPNRTHQHTGVFVSNYGCLSPSLDAHHQNQWGWGSGVCISSRSSVDSHAH